jgi:monofunctional biosynthetic peptidoglycan transglycosylase
MVHLLLALPLYFVGVGTASLVYLPAIGRLAQQEPKTTALVRIRAWDAAEEGRAARHRCIPVPYAEISPHLKHAMLVAEDGKFFEHGGLCLGKIKWCLIQNVRKRQWAYGGSTITQQLAKNLYLTPERTLSRKVSEAVLAVALESRLPKERIFEVYLNHIEWGDGIYGCEAAARAYFGVSAAELTPSQAVRLASITVNPRRYGPFDEGERMARRRKTIAYWMHDAGFLTDAQYEALPFR